MHACLEICVTYPYIPKPSQRSSGYIYHLFSPLWPGILEERLLDSVQVPQKEQGPQTRTGCTCRSWTKLRRCGWCTRCLDNVKMPFCKAWHCEHILQSVADMREQHQNTSSGKVLRSNKGPTWFWSRPPIVAPKSISFTTMDFCWFLPLTVGWAVLDGGGG